MAGTGTRNDNFTKVSGPVLEMPGIRVDALAGESGTHEVPGWDEAERKLLRETIAARASPSSISALAAAMPTAAPTFPRRRRRPMFSQSCRFIGYRGVGVDCTPRK